MKINLTVNDRPVLVEDLSGVPEAGNGSWDFTITLPEGKLRLCSLDGWGSEFTLDGEPIESEDVESLTGSCYEDWERDISAAVLQHLGASPGQITRYWELDGVSIVDAQLVDEQ